MEPQIRAKLPQPLIKAIELQSTAGIQRLEDPPQGIPRYTINSESFFSVTQILDDGKFARVDPRALLHAQILGSVVHLQIENFLTEQEVLANIEDVLDPQQLKLFNVIPPAEEQMWQDYKFGVHEPDTSKPLEELVLKNRIRTAFDQFLEYSTDHTIEVVFTEKVVWNVDYLYAGTLDLVCLLDGKLTIIDHKTSRFIKESKIVDDSYTGQLSAYLVALNKMGQGNLENDIDLRILHLNPLANKPKLISRKFNFERFLKALTRFSKTELNIITSVKSKNSKNGSDQPKTEYKNVVLSCSDKYCNKKSKFPILVDPNILSKNFVRRIAKVDYHEDSNHYTIYHLQIPSYDVERSFIYEIK
ncbi:MAG: PD-(D/E)XK nuclease family protein [Candidatus Hodarchaeales archaeon]|jgi:hypothetical protein